MNNNLYDGYLWYSEQKAPKVLEQEAWDESMLDENANPFIIEGQLYDKVNKISYSIKYVDGRYIKRAFTVTDDELKHPDNIKLSFKAHRMGEGRNLQFLQYYREDVDPLCEGMKVFQPNKLVFIGFKE